VGEQRTAFVSVKLSPTARTQEFLVAGDQAVPPAGEAVVVQTEAGPALGRVVRTIPLLA